MTDCRPVRAPEGPGTVGRRVITVLGWDPAVALCASCTHQVPRLFPERRPPGGSVHGSVTTVLGGITGNPHENAALEGTGVVTNFPPEQRAPQDPGHSQAAQPGGCPDQPLGLTTRHPSPPPRLHPGPGICIPPKPPGHLPSALRPRCQPVGLAYGLHGWQQDTACLARGSSWPRVMPLTLTLREHQRGPS